MNKIYRTVYNRTKQAIVVASEYAKSGITGGSGDSPSSIPDRQETSFVGNVEAATDSRCTVSFVRPIGGQSRLIGRALMTALASAMFLSGFAARAQCVSNTSQGISVSGPDSNCNADNTAYTGPSNQAENTGVLDARNGGVLNAENVTRIEATNPGVQGRRSTNAHAVYATGGGQIVLGDGVTVSTTGSGSRGLFASGVNAGTPSSIVVNGDITITTTGGNGTTYDYGNGIQADAGAQISVHGFADITTGTAGLATDDSGVTSIGTSANASRIMLNDVRIRSAATSSSHGIAAAQYSTITAKQVDILVSGSRQSYTYGILADGTNANVIIEGGKIVEESQSNLLFNTSNSALRAINGGTIEVTKDLTISTNGFGARGIYASEGSTVTLNNTDITIGGNRASASAGIQIGKSRQYGAGPGTVNSNGKLTITQTVSGSPAIFIEGSGSALNAAADTSSTTIQAAGTAIIYGGSSTNTDQDTLAVISLNNANIGTTSATANLVTVGGRVIAGSGLNVKNSTLTAASGGWLLSVTDKTITDAFSTSTLVKSSNFAFNADSSRLTGSVDTVDGSTLEMTLDNSLWTLAPKGATTTSTLTSLTLNGSTIDASAGDFTLVGDIASHGGTFDLSGAQAAAGQSLTLRGDYAGDGGTVILDTFFEGDASSTDKLVIDGGHVSGGTNLLFKRAGGGGAQVNQGIQVVETVNGGVTDPDSFLLSAASDGYRHGSGSIVVGAYDYTLLRGGNGGVSDDWYLVSVQAVEPPPVEPPVNPPVEPPVQPPVPGYRPEVGAYLNNKLAGMAMSQHTLHDRQGQTPGRIDADADSSSWLRIAGSNSHRDVIGSRGRSSRYLVHAGSDVLRFSDGDTGSVHLGAMASYGRDSNKARGNGLQARGEVEGSSVGLYGTWFDQSETHSGLYVDAWAMYSWLHNTVRGQGLPTERYKSKNTSASVEAGYAFKVRDSGRSQLYVEPQAQVIAARYRANDHIEHGRTRVHDMDENAITTRLGVRTYGVIELDQDNAGKTFLPYAELNWWHGPSTQDLSLDADAIRDHLPANRYELKLGAESNIGAAISVWGDIGLETGSEGHSARRAQVGIRYRW
jgi:outer membrane autotransporter protein